MKTVTLSYWQLLFRGWTGIALSDGALAVIAPHVAQMREAM